MRGNRRRALQSASLPGSIPAHAGEPPTPDGSLPRDRVYPRACGGTLNAFNIRPIAKGLSPRMRGNREHRPVRLTAAGSIPAHAGEPTAGSSVSLIARVYPRACGGTTNAQGIAGSSPGLSPRMRGNLFHPSGRQATHGSIPAHAGEPPMNRSAIPCRWVYPRACGGTVFVVFDPGLLTGSIPAHAGEPENTTISI